MLLSCLQVDRYWKHRLYIGYKINNKNAPMSLLDLVNLIQFAKNMKHKAQREAHCKYAKWKENKFDDIIGYKLRMMNLIQTSKMKIINIITKP